MIQRYGREVFFEMFKAKHLVWTAATVPVMAHEWRLRRGNQVNRANEAVQPAREETHATGIDHPSPPRRRCQLVKAGGRGRKDTPTGHP